MDKKNTVIGLLLLGVAFFLFSWQARQAQEFEEARQAEERIRQQQMAEDTPPDTTREAVVPESAGEGPEFLTGVPEGTVAPRITPPLDPGEAGAEPQLVVLTNDTIRVTLTNIGAGIAQVEFLQTTPDGETDPFVFNEGDHLPSHAIEFADPRGFRVPFLPRFEVAQVSEDGRQAVFVYRDPQGLVFERSFSLSHPDSGRDPYVIGHELFIHNETDAPRALPRTYLRLGTARSLAYDRMNIGEFLNVGHYDGSRIRYTKARKFIGSRGFLGFGSRDPVPDFEEEVQIENVNWVSIKNQFFTGVLREVGGGSQSPRASSLVTSAERTGRDNGREPWKTLGISGAVGYNLETIGAGGSLYLGTEFFIGPKEFIRLQRLGDSEERLMQYWGPDIISQALTVLMYGIHKLVPSWGMAIIILVLIIKLVFWPFTSRGMRAQKLNAVKMAPLQGEMRKLNEKYKDNPAAKQKAMMDLYRKHDVNPAAMLSGCLPMLVQIPIFIGLYGMLRVAPEFRFASLLWVEQLAYPDTLFTVSGFPINLLPLVYGIVMYFQMRMTPMPEGADESQKLTFKMLRFMPLILVVVLYNFAAALFVYFTTNSLLTMLQQFLINRKLKPEIDALKADVERKTSQKGGDEAPVAGPAPWEKKKEQTRKAPAKKALPDGLGATRRLKKDSGSDRSRTRRRRKK